MGWEISTEASRRKYGLSVGSCLQFAPNWCSLSDSGFAVARDARKDSVRARLSRLLDRPANPELTPALGWATLSPASHSPNNQKQTGTSRLWQLQLERKRPTSLSSPNRLQGWWTSSSATTSARRTRSCSFSRRR